MQLNRRSKKPLYLIEEPIFKPATDSLKYIEYFIKNDICVYDNKDILKIKVEFKVTINCLVCGNTIDKDKEVDFEEVYMLDQKVYVIGSVYHRKDKIFTLVGIEREIGRKFGRWLDVAIMQCLLHEQPGI